MIRRTDAWVGLVALGMACLAVACSPRLPGRCSSDGDCQGGAYCDKSHAVPVCAVADGSCYPGCPSGQLCSAARCIPAVCTPDCTSSQVCDLKTATCQAATNSAVAITSPSAGQFVAFTLQATATAHAPNGVSGVELDVLQPNSAGVLELVASGPTSLQVQHPSSFAGRVDLGSKAISEGPATVIAKAATKEGTLTSAPVIIQIDRLPPQVQVLSDGRTGWLGPAASTGTVELQATDAGSGVGQASLTLQGVAHAPYPFAREAGNRYAAQIPLADLKVAAGSAATVAFTVDAQDVLGNAAPTLTGPQQVLQVDLAPPSIALSADAGWHAPTDKVTISGTLSDGQSGVASGAAGVSLLPDDRTAPIPGTLSAGGFAVSVDLSLRALPAGLEGPWSFQVRGTDAVGNSASAGGKLLIDDAPPTVGALQLSTAADFTDAGGTAWFGAGSGTLSLAATATDLGSGVDPASVKLVAAAGSPAQFAPIAGSAAGDGKSFSFSLPKSVGAGLDGSAPLLVQVVAADKLAAGMTGAAAARHQAAGPVLPIRFDGVAPAATVDADLTDYTRGSGLTITVRVHATDAGSGAVHAALTEPGGAGTSSAPCAAGVCTLQIATTDAPAQQQTELAVWVVVTDGVGNASAAAVGTRRIDDLPPAVRNLRAALQGAPDPGTSGGVVYPAAMAATGRDGAHFLYSDPVHLWGTVLDAGGLNPATLRYRIDGNAAGGGAGSAPGTWAPLCGADGSAAHCSSTCVPGTTSCDFELTTPLNAAGAGPFANATGSLWIEIDATDVAVPTTHEGSGSTAVAATRFWWSQQLASLSVSGFAVHPSGLVLTTTKSQAGFDTFFALYPDGPFHPGATSPIAWQVGKALYGTAGDLGAIDGPPAVGSGSPALAYVTTENKDVVAVDPVAQRVAWMTGSSGSSPHAGVLETFTKSPSIGSSIVGCPSGCETVFAVGDALWAVSSGQFYRSSSTMSSSSVAPLLLVGGKAYAATNAQVVRDFIDPRSGAWSAAIQAPAPSTISALATDATRVLGVGTNALKPELYSFDLDLKPLASPLGLTAPIVGAPVLDAPGAGGAAAPLWFSEAQKRLVSATLTQESLLAGESAQGRALLLGADGRVYLGQTGGSVVAIDQASGTTNWSYALPADVSADLALDCQGHLYVAAGDTVYALITDSPGLRGGSAWPKPLRDARNSSNADAAVLWGARVNGTCTQ